MQPSKDQTPPGTQKMLCVCLTEKMLCKRDHFLIHSITLLSRPPDNETNTANNTTFESHNETNSVIFYLNTTNETNPLTSP